MTEALTIKVPEAARLIGVAKSTLYKAIYETERDGIGLIAPGVKAFKIRGTWRVSRPQLDQFLADPGGPSHGR